MEKRSIFDKAAGLIIESLPERVSVTTGDSMPGRAIRVTKSRSFTTLTKVMKSRVFIGYLRYSPIFTEGPKNIFSERLTYRINLVYSQMARG